MTARASQCLAAAGYGDRVAVVLADAEQGVPGAAPFDVIIVTASSWDIPRAWLEQLADGVIVVPLRINGITRSIAFRREEDHLVSTSAQPCGFVPVRGAGQHAEQVFLLPDPRGGNVRFRFDTGAPEDLSRLDGVLASGRAEAWSGVTIRNQMSFADLFLWFASFLTGFCQLAADEGTELAAERGYLFPSAVVRGDSFAGLVLRPALDGAGAEFGARAYGPHGEIPAAAMVEQIRAWDQLARRDLPPEFAFWPAGASRTRLPEGAAVFEKTHGTVAVNWPAVP